MFRHSELVSESQFFGRATSHFIFHISPRFTFQSFADEKSAKGFPLQSGAEARVSLFASLKSKCKKERLRRSQMLIAPSETGGYNAHHPQSPFSEPCPELFGIQREGPGMRSYIQPKIFNSFTLPLPYEKSISFNSN